MEEIQPYMDFIDYTPGKLEKAMVLLRKEIFKSLGIPKKFLSEDGKLTINEAYIKYSKRKSKCKTN